MGLDSVPAPNALTDAFGDSYLYCYNPIYRSIRDSTLGLGYRFSAEDTPLWRDYQSLSLVALHRILSTKIIPYFDTATSFRRLIGANPQARLPPGMIAGNVKRNFAFHESAHCVAHSIMRKFAAELRALAPGEANRVAIEAIFAESFANTVEALGSIFRHMPVSDSVFYPLNSYLALEEKRTHLLNDAGAALGAELRFALLFLSYFEANLATQPPADSVYARIAEAGECNAGQAGVARGIVDVGFRLHSGFRESTTPAYFELIGLGREYDALVSANWLCHAQNRSFSLALSRVLWEAVGSV